MTSIIFPFSAKTYELYNNFASDLHSEPFIFLENKQEWTNKNNKNDRNTSHDFSMQALK